MSLSEIQEGQIFKIIAVNPVSSEFLLYLESLGIEIHSSGRVISKSPLDGLVKIRINHKSKFNEQTLGSNITDQIYVAQI